MDRSEYAILAVIAAATVGLGVFTTTQPLGTFLVESAREALSTTAAMAWVTWWALVVGFAIAGGVEAWTSGEEVSELLEGHGPSEIGYGSLFGFVSSSCSYSAIATAKNLFKKGGSAAATLGAFMFASTNLVIEIGAVIWILLGWQFLVADILGGFILIGLMAFGFVYLVPDEVVEQARRNVQDEGSETVRDPVCGMEVDPDETEYSVERDGRTFYFCSKSCKESFDPEEANTTVRERATSLSGWKALADKQWKEWGMLWDEIAIGFVFAGLIVPPIVDAYREYYGTTFAAVLSGMIFVAAVLTGVVIHFVFLGAGLIPAPESVQIAEVSIEADYKLVLNVFATGLFGVLYWLHRSESVGDDGHGGHGEAAQAGD
ncbi:permease [Haloferax volcanii]|uniref:permease n=1 Tax=Haloferax volcanii TaxID=2246 RepID=UPI0023DAE23B|nr:permease [Haloferax lucentense]WEL25695.1 Putative permease [Haloferax lucentense]